MFLNAHQDKLALKIKQYEVAIEKYKNIPWYTRFEFFFSIIVITLQIITSVKLFQQYNSTNILAIVITLFFSYFLTDFINGFVHMIVDNNDHYTSIVGPFVAAFHLHHVKLTYQNKHPLKIYFYESGHKIWLVFYLMIIFIIQCLTHINFCVDLSLVSMGVLSSVAELSHFWCHNKKQTNRFIRLLQKYRVLLPMKHHRLHHRHDNTHYAFLNGMSDFWLNMIAKRFYSGYKNFSDQHVAVYEKQSRDNIHETPILPGELL